MPRVRTCLISAYLAVVATMALSAPTDADTGHGHFSGNPVVEFLPDGRKIKLREAFIYTDPDGNVWPVPVNYIADGASIPRGLWTPVGGPLDGPYRDASIVHDYYCEHFDTRWNESYKLDWKSVHRAFYQGLLARGVGPKKAKLMYGAVYYCGPRWEWQGQQVRRVDTWCATGGDINAEDVLAEFIESGDRSLEDIEALGESDKRFKGLISTKPMAPQAARPPKE